MTKEFIPDNIVDDEDIFRDLYSPYHVNEKKHKVRPQAIRPKLTAPDEDDSRKVNNKVSTTRKDFASYTFCKNHALAHADENRKYAGFLSVKAGDVRGANAEMQVKPVDDNPAHANIVYPMVNHLIGEEVEPLTDAALKECMTKIVDAGKYISAEEIEQILQTAPDDTDYPESGVSPFKGSESKMLIDTEKHKVSQKTEKRGCILSLVCHFLSTFKKCLIN